MTSKRDLHFGRYVIDYPLVHLRASGGQNAGRIVVSHVLVVAVFGAGYVGQIAANGFEDSGRSRSVPFLIRRAEENLQG